MYKASVKDDLTKWQNVLRAHSSTDWLIVVVENDAKKKNKTNILPRTSLVDKIRSDFCNKQSDRWARDLRQPHPDPGHALGMGTSCEV